MVCHRMTTCFFNRNVFFFYLLVLSRCINEINNYFRYSKNMHSVVLSKQDVIKGTLAQIRNQCENTSKITQQRLYDKIFVDQWNFYWHPSFFFFSIVSRTSRTVRMNTRTESRNSRFIWELGWMYARIIFSSRGKVTL